MGQDQRPSRGEEVSRLKIEEQGQTDRKTDRQTEIWQTDKGLKWD